MKTDGETSISGKPVKGPTVFFAGCALAAVGFIFVSVSCFFQNEAPVLPGFLKLVINYYTGLAAAAAGIVVALHARKPEDLKNLPEETRSFRVPVIGAVYSVIALFLFFRTLDIGFLCDDYVLNDVAVYGIRGSRSLFLEQKLIGYWRPIAGFEWRLMIAVFGLKPFFFHAVNLIVHAVNATLLFVFLKKAFRLELPAALAGVFFLIYPATVGAVVWPCAAPDQIAVMFVLLALVFSLSFLRNGSWWRFLLAAVFSAAAPLTKESGFAVLPLVVLAAFLLARKKEREEVPFRRRTALAVACAALVVVIFIVRYISLGGLGAYRAISPSPGRYLTILQRMVTDPRYLFGAWLAPVNRAMYGEDVPVVPIILCAACAGIIAAGVLFGFRKRLWRPIVFGAAVTFFGLLPVLHLLRSFDYQSCARYMYMPTLGVCILLGIAVAALAKRGLPWKGAVVLLVLAWVVMLRLNTMPWIEAGKHCRALEGEAQRLAGSPDIAADRYYFLYLPPHVDGAMTFAVGFRHMLTTHAGFSRKAKYGMFFIGSQAAPKKFAESCARFGSGARLIVYDPPSKTLEDVTAEAMKAYSGKDETVTVPGDRFVPGEPSGGKSVALLLEQSIPLRGLWKVEIGLSSGSGVKPDKNKPVRLRLRGIGKILGEGATVRMRLTDILIFPDETGGSGQFSEPVESVFQRGIAKSLRLDLPPGLSEWKLGEIRFIYRKISGK